MDCGGSFDATPIVAYQFGAVQETCRLQAGQVIRGGNPRTSLNSKNGVIFNPNSRSGIQPITKIACELSDVAEIVAVGRSLGSRETGEAVFLLIPERQEAREMPIQRVLGLRVDEVPVGLAVEQGRVYASEIQDAPSTRHETIGAPQSDLASKKIRT